MLGRGRNQFWSDYSNHYWLREWKDDEDIED